MDENGQRVTHTRSTAWDTYARSRPQRRETNAEGETTWFNWTQYPDHGPGADVPGLAPGDRVLDSASVLAPPPGSRRTGTLFVRGVRSGP